MENEEKYEEMNEETVEEEKKGLKEKVKDFFGKPIVKKITTGVAVVGAALIGYAFGANSGSNGEGNGEEAPCLPDPASDNDGNTAGTTDYVDNTEDMTTDENDDGMSETNESEGSAE